MYIYLRRNISIYIRIKSKSTRTMAQEEGQGRRRRPNPSFSASHHAYVGTRIMLNSACLFLVEIHSSYSCSCFRSYMHSLLFLPSLPVLLPSLSSHSLLPPSLPTSLS